MKEPIKNTFHSGMIKDISDNIKDPSSFEDGFNIRLNSNSSDSEHVVVNIKGNKFSFDVPDIPNILTITPNEVPATYSTTVALLTSIGPVFGNSISGTSDIDDMMDKIEDSLRNSPSFTSLELNVSRNGDIIRVWSNVVDIISYNTASTLTSIDLQTTQTQQLPIGWTRIDDDIYIASTNDDSIIGGIMAWWKVVYDKVSLSPTITLIYSNNLNMSTRYPIANPGGIESVKENSRFIRSYWTDSKFNVLRSINFADPNIMAVTPEQLSIQLKSVLRKPTLESVQNGGSLIMGHYQVAYALGTRGGGLTNYSHTSNSIFINEDSLSERYSDYQGGDSGIITNKSFTVKITDIDTSFDFIEIIVLRVESADASPLISKVAELAITNSELQYTHTGSEPAVIVTEDAFNRRINLFDKCHALAQKDNILFAANTTGESLDIDFDARAYRFDSNGDCVLEDISGIQTPHTSASLALLDETDDAINPDQTIYKYQSDGVTLGGEGPNVKYEFTYRSLVADARQSSDYIFPYRLPWLVGEDGTIELGDGTVYQEGGHYSDFKSPYIDHIYRGYRREETYRFALVPIKNNKEGYAKWIADIKMPAIFEEHTINTAIDDPINQGKVFPLTSQIDNIWHVNTLGVKFTVNIPNSVINEIDEWVIKRVKLEPEDRTILAQGIVHMSVKSEVDNTYHPVLGNDSNDAGLAPDFSLNPSTSTANTNLTEFSLSNNIVNGVLRSYPIISFHSPDFLFGKPLNSLSGDKLRIVQGLNTSATTRFQEPNSIPAHHTVISKLYNGMPYVDPLNQGEIFDVEDGRTIGFDSDFTVGSFDYENRSLFMNSGGITGRRSRGTDTTVLKLDRGFMLGTYNNMQGSGIPFYPASGLANYYADKYVVNYERENAGQYGGQGYSARSQNIYINTGCHVIVNKDNPTETVSVYGGDTYVNIFDTLKMTKNFIDFDSAGTGEKRVAVGLYYPVESFVNTDMRHGYSLNGDQNLSGGFYGEDDQVADAEQYPLDYGEDFKYNYVFSEQMDTQRSFPLPLSVTEVLEHPVRIWASAPKIYGELADSWRIFDSETYIDIQGDLGEIRQLMNSSDNIVAWQQRGMGIASVNERSVVNDNIGGGIVLGQSGVLPRFDYISKSIGSWHQFSFIKSPNGTMFFDSKDGGLYLYASQGLKDVTVDKIKGWLYKNTRGNILKNDSPHATGNTTRIGVCGTYDNRNREFLITFYDNDTNLNNSGIVDLVGRSFTIGYNDTKDRFTGFKGFKPTMYINDDKYALTANPSNENSLYLHDIGERGKFYDEDPQESYIIITVNPASEVSKVFDNTEWLSEVYDINNVEQTAETFDNITSYNSYQTTGIRTDIKRILRKWNHAITYEFNTRNRIRSNWMKQKFSFLNNNNKEFKLHHIINYFRKFPN